MTSKIFVSIIHKDQYSRLIYEKILKVVPYCSPNSFIELVIIRLIYSSLK